jgi:hypothetical protein
MQPAALQFGGAEQIPYLTVYAVLPTSLAFVAIFAKFSARWWGLRASCAANPMDW